MHSLMRIAGFIAMTAGLMACIETPSEPRPIPDLALSSARAKVEWPLITVRIAGDPTHSITNDGLGDYVNGQGGVSSVLQGGIGDWVFDLTGRGTSRSLRLDLSQALPGNSGPAPFASALVKPRLIALGSVNLPGSFNGMTGLNSTLESPLATTFTHNGTDYALRMNARNHQGTDWVRVICTAVAPVTAQCTNWELTPNGSYDGVQKNVALLERVTNRGNVSIGKFYVTFRIELSR